MRSYGVLPHFDGYGCTFRDLMQMMYRGGRRGIGTGPGQLGCSEMLLLCKHDTRQAVSDAVRERGIERLAREVDQERRLGVQRNPYVANVTVPRSYQETIRKHRSLEAQMLPFEQSRAAL